MPFIRYHRDKRGYESTIVMHAYRTVQGAPRSRVLYLFRSPAHLQVGRRVLDEEVVEALEHTHPDITFDWPALLREQSVTRAEPRPRPRRPEGRPSPPGRAATGRPPAAARPVEVDDQSLLGRVLGAAEAGRLRRRYADLLQRATRRTRTPEERDRLTDRVKRLNPDEWTDESAVRAGAGTVDAEFDAIAEELPARRRGRRGGRRHGPEPTGPAEPSAIMEAGGDEADEAGETLARGARDSGAAGDGGGSGSEPAGGSEPAADDLRRPG